MVREPEVEDTMVSTNFDVPSFVALKFRRHPRPMLPILSPFLLARYDCERESFAKEGMRDTLYPSQRGLQNQKNDRKRKIEKNVDREKGGVVCDLCVRGE